MIVPSVPSRKLDNFILILIDPGFSASEYVSSTTFLKRNVTFISVDARGRAFPTNCSYASVSLSAFGVIFLLTRSVDRIIIVWKETLIAMQRKPNNNTREKILNAAGAVLVERGYSNVSTRLVAKTAGVPLSQIHYHFSSKQGLILGLFEYRNAQLLERQNKMFSDGSLSISDQWDLACQYLDEDIDSGYVQTLMELCAAGWSDPEIAEIVHETILAWLSLIAGVAERAEARFGTLGPFSHETIAALVGSAFIGAEAFLLLNVKTQAIPVRRALDEFGELLRACEEAQS